MQLPHQGTLFLDPLHNKSHFIEFGWKKNKWRQFSSIFACSSLFPFSSKPDIIVLPFRSLYFSVYSTCHHVFIVHYQPWPAFLNCPLLPLPPTLCLSPSAYVFCQLSVQAFLHPLHQNENEADWDRLLGRKGSLKPAKLRVSGRINLFTATKEDFVACFEGQGCLRRVIK